jgi:uncharacterized repeat protein (TIGR03803 family)
VVYSFKGGSNGALPYSGLINVVGTLYGTTTKYGGSSNVTAGPGGCGTVFSVTPAGAEAVVYSFKGRSDATNPSTGVLTPMTA